MAIPSDGEIAWGWTVDDTERLARHCARSFPSEVLTYDDRRDAAQHAVVCALLEATEQPAGIDLLTAGCAAVRRACHEERRHHGMDDRHPFEKRAAWSVYWHGALLMASPFEDTVVDRLALRQVWPLLTSHEQLVLRTLAAYDGYPGSAAPAADLGMNQSTFSSNLTNGRRRFKVWWFEGETPPRMWMADRVRTARGVSMTAERRQTARRGRREKAS